MRILHFSDFSNIPPDFLNVKSENWEYLAAIMYTSHGCNRGQCRRVNQRENIKGKIKYLQIPEAKYYWTTHLFFHIRDCSFCSSLLIHVPIYYAGAQCFIYSSGTTSGCLADETPYLVSDVPIPGLVPHSHSLLLQGVMASSVHRDRESSLEVNEAKV